MKVLLGVTGSIAAYKTLYLARELQKEGADVTVILTKSAQYFISSVSLSSLIQREVFTDDDFFTPRKYPLHIELAKWADIMLIAPATANTLAKLATGLADDLLSSTALSAKVPIILAPAMHTEMWESEATRDNVIKLRKRGFEFVGPVEGELSTGERGMGRMAEPEDIVAYLLRRYETKKILEGKKIVVAYGRTEEPIDQVRVITNRSSGKMGLALVEEAKKLGATVYAVEGEVVTPPPPTPYYVKVKTADEMLEALHSLIQDADALIMAAAVSDLKPARKKKTKLKREKTKIDFIPTPDILEELSRKKREDQVFVGFALEDKKKLLKDAREKMKKKNVDIVVANPLEVMGSDWTEGYLLTRGGEEVPVKAITKREMATLILEKLAELLVSK